MGQKIHPTGFRIGITKQCSVNWYANYRTFSAVLKEDYRIRKFFEKKLEQKKGSPFYRNAGIVKLEIQRKINQLELIIHASRPKAFFDTASKTNLLVSLKNDLNDFVFKPVQIRIKVLRVVLSMAESSLIAKYIAGRLEKRVAFRKVISKTIPLLQRCDIIKGFKVQVSGRLNGAEIARSEWVRDGRVPLQTLNVEISYTSYRAYTTYGVIGIKVWLFIEKSN
jgi:small subunit ribosomal protein S3